MNIRFGAFLLLASLCVGAAPPSVEDPAVQEALAARGVTAADVAALREASGGAGLPDSMAFPGKRATPDPARDLLDAMDAEADSAARVLREDGGRAARGDSAVAGVGEPKLPDTAPLPRFGDDFFALPPDAFSPARFGPVSPDYRLGPGDEVVLDVWGDTVFRHVETIGREGTVLLPDVGQVMLQGLTLASARRALRDRLSTVYSGLDRDPPTAFLDVTLGRVRTLRVFVAGDVARPGGYDVTAASTALHVLWLAGGPTARGSLRGVQVVRGDEVVSTLDLYRLLLSGRRPGDVRLESDDVLFVPGAGPVVEIRGEVARPGRYELAGDEGLADLVRMAGGATALTAMDRARIERVLPPAQRDPHTEDRVVLDVDLGAVLRGDTPFALADLDVVELFSVPPDRRDWVAVRGNVWRPSVYEWRDGMRVSDLVLVADSLRADTWSDRALLVRTRPDRSRETLSFDLGRAMAGDPAANLVLRPRDELVVFSRWDLEDRKTVSIFGAVRRPGTYELGEGMSPVELILQAGGFVQSSWTVDIEVSRVDPSDDAPRIAETFRIEAGGEFPASPGLAAFRLRDHDNVFVREIPQWELQRNVQISGEVRFPGVYTLRRADERLSEVLERAGGLLPTAFARGFRLDRARNDVGPVSVDLERALERPGSEHDLILASGDELVVPERPMTVKVEGGVWHPTSLVWREGMSIGDYVRDSGGFSDRARKGDVTVVYSTGRAAKVRRFRRDPAVEPGSRIVVPVRPENDGIDWGSTIKDTAQILASLATTYLVIDRIAN